MRPGLTLVMHINAFTRKVEGGYLMNNGQKISDYMPRGAIITYMMRHIVQVEALYV